MGRYIHWHIYLVGVDLRAGREIGKHFWPYSVVLDIYIRYLTVSNSPGGIIVLERGVLPAMPGMVMFCYLILFCSAVLSYRPMSTIRHPAGL